MINKKLRIYAVHAFPYICISSNFIFYIINVNKKIFLLNRNKKHIKIDLTFQKYLLKVTYKFKERNSKNKLSNINLFENFNFVFTF